MPLDADDPLIGTADPPPTDPPPADPPPTDPPPADPPAGDEPKPEEAPKSALEAVRRVIDKNREAAAADAKAQQDAQQTTTVKEEPAAGDKGDKDLTGFIDANEWKTLPELTRKRITQYREKLKAADTAVQQLAPKAKTYDDLVGYCKVSGLNQEDFQQGLEIMRMVRQDPAAAWKALQPIIEHLKGHVGETLPEDLAKEVNEGTLNEARARELTAARKERERLESQQQARARADSETQQRTQAEETAFRLQRAVEGWENQWKGSDPDYKLKAERVWERMRSLLDQETQAVTPRRAVEIANQAKKDIETFMSGLAPKKQPKDMVNNTGNGGVTNKEPSSALEAARMALAATRAAN